MAPESTAALEIGSEFHWMGLPEPPYRVWPEPHVWFALGSDALLAVWQQTERADRVLWIPDYFCPDTAAHWERAGVPLRRYSDDPRWSHPDWETLTPRAGDLVTAVNYFGVRAGYAWQTWHEKHSAVTLIEDHSHDPLSAWARQSTADYAFASVRKTHPVPDGGILWSPRGHPLPAEPPSMSSPGSALKLAGMIWKAAYLASPNRDLATKEVFRGFQSAGEVALAAAPSGGISLWSRAFLAPGSPVSWRQRREANVRFFLQQMETIPNVQPLFTDWPSDHCPLHAVVLFDSAARRAAVRAELLAAGVYAPVHWEQGPEAPARCHNLAQRIMTLPADQRYHSQDLACVVSIIAGACEDRRAHARRNDPDH